MLQHFCSVFNGSRLGQPAENAAEIGSIAKATADGNVFQFEIVIAQEEFAARNADVSEIVYERHVTVPVKDTREMVRAHGENPRDRITCDVILIIPLQINTDAFEKILCPVCALRRWRFMDDMLHALDQRGGELGKCRRRFS